MQRVSKESSDVGRAEESAEAMEQQLATLNRQFEEELEALSAGPEPIVEGFRVQPKKTNIAVKFVALGWRPR